MDDKNTLKAQKMDDRKLLIALETFRVREKQIEEAPSWQHYADDIKIDKSSIIPMGFHKAYDERSNRKIIDILDKITVFPHYYVSFYGSNGEEPVKDSRNEMPWIYRSNSYKNIGTHSFVRSWDSSTMAGESFMMFMGWPKSIMADMEAMVSSARKHRTLWCGNDMVTDLYYLCRLGGEENLTDDYVEDLENVRRVSVEIGDSCEYHSFVLKTKDIATSVQISPDTRRNIDDWKNKGLIPLCQIPFGLGGYHHPLIKDFGWEEKKVPKADFAGKKHPMFAITPPCFGHACGAFYDAEKGRVIGKRKQITRFIQFFNQENLLHEHDLKYLI